MNLEEWYEKKKGIWIFSIFLVLLVIGGMYAVEKWNTPDTPAFNDKFTKEFLIKDAKTPEGFHMLESGTKKYSILVPDDYVMIQESYYRKKGIGAKAPDTENIYITKYDVSPEKDGIIKGIKLFLNPNANIRVQTRLEKLLEDISAPSDKEIKTIKDEDKTVYFADNIHNFEFEDGTSTYYYLYALVADNHSKQAISIELRHACFDSDKRDCEIDFNKEKNMGIKMLESVVFK